MKTRTGPPRRRSRSATATRSRRRSPSSNKKPDVEYAVPNYIARPSFVPNDPGWTAMELPRRLRHRDARRMGYRARRGAPGGQGATVAVLDTGVAYRRTRRFRRAPDLNHFTRGTTSSAATAAPTTPTATAPISRAPSPRPPTTVAAPPASPTGRRSCRCGCSTRRARATPPPSRAHSLGRQRRPDVINLSLEFSSGVRASDVPDVDESVSLRPPQRRGRRGRLRQLGPEGVVASRRAALGHRGRSDHPSRLPGRVLQRRPRPRRGGPGRRRGRQPGLPTGRPVRPPRLQPDETAGIYQQTFTSSVRRFGLPRGYEGTSMAAAHVSGIVALIRSPAPGRAQASPAAVEQHLERTARDLGSRASTRATARGS